jgi:hypothetical protein
MSELQIDDDWKRQAQDEKRKLAEEAEKRKAAAAPSAAPSSSGAGAGRSRELPPPSFAQLVSSIVTQALYYLGELAPQGGEPTVSLDMARHHIDSLAILDEKTKGNLTADERQALDAALYETRMRFVSVARQMTR